MCFYSVTDYQCGDWKWGTMQERCQRQRHHQQQQQQQQHQQQHHPHQTHRVAGQGQSQGQSQQMCKVKLIHTETSQRVADKMCRTCEAIQVKHRRQARLQERMAWKRAQPGGHGRFENSLARMEQEMDQLSREIDALEQSRESRAKAKTSSTSTSAAAAAAAAKPKGVVGASSSPLSLSSANGARGVWEPSCDCQSPTAEMMSRLLPARW